MDFSKFKIELYDLFGLLVPGLILQADCAMAVMGWHGYVSMVAGLSGNLIAASLALSYVLGHLVQEAGDILVGSIRGDRYLKAARDKLWSEDDGRTVREVIKAAIGHEIQSVDVAYDYCLSRVKSSFEKRDAFIATSDLARSFVFLSFTTALALLAAVWKADVRGWRLVIDCLGVLSLSGSVALVSWRRMMRFREFSDRPVFAAYLAAHGEQEGKQTSTVAGKT